MAPSVCYEQPLNERVRILLRLEFLLQQILQAASGTSVWDSRCALLGLCELLSLMSRNELKGDLLKELDRHSAVLGRLREVPQVDNALLQTILDEIAEVMERLRQLDSVALAAVRQNEFLNAIRQRLAMPGGTCQFDLPALHHWLQQPGETRTRHLHGWLQLYQPLREAVDLMLRLIRHSAVLSTETARSGFFQQSLDSSAPNQMIRVLLPPGSSVFPEISGGRQRFSIRFLEQPDPQQRVRQSTEDIGFQLMRCVI